MTLTRYTSAADAGLALLTLLQGFAAAPTAPHPAPETVRLEEAALAYREPGEFLDRGTPVNGPRVPLTLEAPLTIMRAQVTRGAYDACVADGACLALGTKGAPDLPVTGVNFIDAEAYAAWLSVKTGETWRLPTDREWALAAGSRFKDDAYTEISDPANPSRRWIAVYDIESKLQEEIDPKPMPAGHFGTNEHGLLDLAGNVWEWTSTCYRRHHVLPGGEVRETENCGIRVAEGRHRALMTTFFRDPKAGACSVGVPPANLGIRLVREETGVRQWLGF